jgi:hypothetical protein
VTSDEVTRSIEIQCAAPTIVPNGGVFEDSQSVSITTNEPAGTTHYTINGDTPTQSDPTTVPFELTATSTVKARTFRSGTSPSAVVESAFSKAFRPALAGRNNARLYISVNNFATWTEIQPLGNTNQNWRIGQIGDAGLFAQVATQTAVRYSLDQLQTWLTPTFPSALVSIVSMKSNKVGDKVIMCANIGNARNQILLSVNGGASFVDISPNTDTYLDCAISPDGTKLYAARSGGGDAIYMSENNGSTWSVVYNEASRQVLELTATDGSLYYTLFTTADSFLGVYRSDLDGSNRAQIFTSTGNYRQILASGDDSLLVLMISGTTGNLKVSYDQGDNFEDVSLLSASVVVAKACSYSGQRVLFGLNTRINGSLDKLNTIQLIEPIANNNWQLVATTE